MFDGPVWGVLIGVVGLILLLGLRFFKRAAARAGSAAGEKLGAKVSQRTLPPLLEKLGATLRFDAPVEVAHEVVTAAIAQKPKTAEVVDEGAYTLRAVEPGDVHVALVSDGAEAELRVTGFREYFGTPQGAPFVTQFLARVRAEADTCGVPVREGRTVNFARGEEIDAKNAYWRKSVDQ